MLDHVIKDYDKKHIEIFNPIEQDRLRDSFKVAISQIKSASFDKVALDYGCGSGNITRHLIDLGMSVVCADVSYKFLKSIKIKFNNSKKTSILKINGQDLSVVADSSFDLVAVYSVLHHIPDYLSIIVELARVAKPGGVIYLDHERSESSWLKNRLYTEFLKEVELNSPAIKKGFKKYFILANYLDYISNYIVSLRRLINPRYQLEGDIHVWPDDHIEWAKVERVLVDHGCEVVSKKDYLLYKNYPLAVYEKYKDKCNDYSLIVARKK
jgi:ubiquinone/menaquinone biosynthesis C-methylase UbiE